MGMEQQEYPVASKLQTVGSFKAEGAVRQRAVSPPAYIISGHIVIRS